MIKSFGRMMIMLNKRNPREHLDEMQVQTRNKVGHQCFFMLFSLLMIDLFLKDNGVKWAASPMSEYAIIVLCMVYYGTRIVWAGASAGTLGTHTKSKKHLYLIVGLLAAMTTILSVLAIIRTKFLSGSFNISYNGVLRLFIFSFVFILIIVVSNIISRHKNNAGND